MLKNLRKIVLDEDADVVDTSGEEASVVLLPNACFGLPWTGACLMHHKHT